MTMKLLDIPPEVIDGHILPYLQWNDLLRFRRVCKDTKLITDGFLDVHPELAPELEINEEDKTFRNFLEMGIPTTKIYLRNDKSAYNFFKGDLYSIFLETYGPLIKSLRVDQLSMIVSGEELLFMEAFVNLEHLTIGHFNYGIIEGGDITSQTEDQMERAYREYLSRTGKENVSFLEESPVTWLRKNATAKLKVLKIGQQEHVWPQVQVEVDMTGVLFMLEYAATLEYVALPFLFHADGGEDPLSPENALRPENSVSAAMSLFLSYVEKPQVNSAGKTIDFVNFHDPRVPEVVHFNCANAFQSICYKSVEFGVGLKNVPASWFGAMVSDPEVNRRRLGEPILSVVGFHPALVLTDMSKLERIEIRSTSTSSAGHTPIWKMQRQEWSTLKELDITVDSNKSEFVFYWIEDSQLKHVTIATETMGLFQFFFQDIVRPEMTELRLNFVEDADSVAIPKAVEIVASCPNLKRLTLVNWPGKNKALIELFGGLPELEEVSLEHCQNLGNVAFVGLDNRSPVFFKLPKLKKLALKGLDQMPKITDLLFTMVIRHLKLTQLTLTSDSPVTTVSSHGIRALLEGDFAKSIEKFSLQGLTLEDVTTADLHELEKQFRSYYMI